MKRSIRFRRTTLICVWLVALLAGLGLARVWSAPHASWLFVAVFFALLTARKRSMLTLVSVVLAGVVIGLWRGAQFSGQLEPYRQHTGKEVTFTATVQSDAVYQDGQLSFDVADVRFIKPAEGSVPGRVAVKGYGERAVYRGDNLRITGKLTPARGSRQARVSFSSFIAEKRNDSPIERFRSSFVAGIGNALPEPAASFGLGLLIGYRTNLPEITSEQLAITGLTHIIAVSGYNLTIIVRGTRRALKSASKYQQTAACAALIILFLLVTDFSASIVRASIVSGLSLAAWYYGRRFKPLLILAMAAAITAIWNPLYIWSDIGWYLSFLAFFGILIIAPLAATLLYQNRRQPSQLTMLLVETSAAQLMTAPLILYIFSRASLIGLVSNLLIGPLVPVAMLLTLLAGLSGMLTPILAGYIAFPARLLLRYILEMVALMARIPSAMVERSISLVHMLLMYGVVASGTVVAYRRRGNRYGTITDKNTII